LIFEYLGFSTIIDSNLKPDLVAFTFKRNFTLKFFGQFSFTLMHLNISYLSLNSLLTKISFAKLILPPYNQTNNQLQIINYWTDLIWLCCSSNIYLCVHIAIAIPWCCFLSSHRLCGRGHHSPYWLTLLCMDPFKWFLGWFLLRGFHLERLGWVETNKLRLHEGLDQRWIW
jgi:hypothetical protein